LKNALGYPKMSSFATYAYCASSHCDTDDSATSGYVINRPKDVNAFNFTAIVMLKQVQIPRNESNFVWTSHNLIVELDHMAYWFWNAPEDAHGTTQNSMALKHPLRYSGFILDPQYKDKAQWTRVFVIPTAVAAATTREDKRAEDSTYLYLGFFQYLNNMQVMHDVVANKSSN
jgi:hypothetical protein